MARYFSGVFGGPSPMSPSKVVPVGPQGAGPFGADPRGFRGAPGFADPGSPMAGTYLPMPPSRLIVAGGAASGGYVPSPTAAMAARPVTPRTMAMFERRNNPGSPARTPTALQPLPLLDVDPAPPPLPGGAKAPPAEIQPTSPGWNRIPPKPPVPPRPPAPPPLPPDVDLPPVVVRGRGPLAEGLEDLPERTDSARAPVSPLHSFREGDEDATAIPPWFEGQGADDLTAPAPAAMISEIQPEDDDEAADEVRSSLIPT